MNQLAVLPVVVPLLAAAVLAIVGDERRGLVRVLGLGSAALQWLLALVLLTSALDDAPRIYELGDWPAPYGIVLVLDRLSALMLLLTATVSGAALLYATSEWERRGRHFHTFWQLQLMGLNGAFLTGDLFNLFVFFEVLLAASYCLLLHGQGPARARAAFHYVVINLTASAIFLIAVSLLYSVTGTLNLAHLSARIAALGGTEAAIAGSAGLMLLVVFAVKAALFPFYFWLPASYPAAAAPVACLFAIMTKVGVYAIIRVYPLLYGQDAGPNAALATPWLFAMAIATVLFGALGALRADTLRGLAAYLTILSLGTLFIVAAQGTVVSLTAATYYLVHSTAATAALFLIAEVVSRERGETADRLIPGPSLRHPFLIGFALALAAGAAVGLPPTSGFIGKVLVLQAVADGEFFWMPWLAVLVASFVALVAVSRSYSVLLWNTFEQRSERSTIGAARVASVGVLLALLGALIVGAGPLLQFSERTAQQVIDRHAYTRSVLDPRAIGNDTLESMPFIPGHRQ